MRVQRLFFSSLIALFITVTAWASGRAPVPLTLVAVPAQFTPLQIGQDLEARYPAVLVSYQEDPNVGGLFLHAWDGRNWVAVSQDDFARAGFVKMTPKRTVIIGSGPGSSTLVDLADGWCPEVLNLASTQAADIVNTMGRLFEFNASEWRWFAKRYDMELTDLNEGRRQESWYDQPYTDPERSRHGSVLDTPSPTAHTMTWPPSAPARVERVETVGTVKAAETIQTEDTTLPEAPAAPAPALRTTPVEGVQLRPPAFRGWQAVPAAQDDPDMK